MGSSQQHGFVVEDILKKEFDRQLKDATSHRVVPPPISTRYTARFDIPSHRDPYGKGLPTSIKACRFTGPRTLVCLSDAVRISGLGDMKHMRLLVALYRQEGQEKNFSEVREYLIEGSEWRKLMGEAPTDVIEEFHEALREPDHRRARVVAREWKQRMAEDFPSAMRWNPKIDSKNQRRLQCSVRLEDIEAVITDKSRIRVFGRAFPQSAGQPPRPAYLKPKSRHLWGDGVCLPFSIASPPRQRQPKSTPQPSPLPAVSVVVDPAPRRRSGRSMVK